MSDATMQPPSGERTRVAIACQGGGSDTAFTAGVLKRLLRQRLLERYEIVALSGTSGGAVCAWLAWSALARREPERAGRLLDAFWRDNSARSPYAQLANAWAVWASSLQHVVATPTLSPYDNPFAPSGLADFRALLERHVARDGAVDRATAPQLLVGAVDVLSGELRAFNSRREEISVDMVLDRQPVAAPGAAFRGEDRPAPRRRLAGGRRHVPQGHGPGPRAGALARVPVARHGVEAQPRSGVHPGADRARQARAGEFLDALAFERACLSRALDSAMDYVDDDATLVSRAPFSESGPSRGAEHVRRFLREHGGGGLAIDLTRKQVAGSRVTWTARAVPGSVPGTVRAEFRDGRITTLELGGREA